jgi:hypothetical protein
MPIAGPQPEARSGTPLRLEATRPEGRSLLPNAEWGEGMSGIFCGVSGKM